MTYWGEKHPPTHKTGLNKKLFFFADLTSNKTTYTWTFSQLNNLERNTLKTVEMIVDFKNLKIWGEQAFFLNKWTLLLSKEALNWSKVTLKT